MRRKLRKRPCSECRRWFLPNPRVGARQKTCGDPKCQRLRRRKQDAAWRARHPDYDRGRRWQNRLDRTLATGKVVPPREVPLVGVPWDLAEQVLGPGPVMIAAELAGLMGRHAQVEMGRQLRVLEGKSARLALGGAQDEMGAYLPDFEGDLATLAPLVAQDEMGGGGRPP